MKTRSKIGLTIVGICLLFSMILFVIDLRRTYKTTHRLAAQDAERCPDCTYSGPRLSYSQIYLPPKILRLPHWEVTETCTNPLHRGKRLVTFSEARARAKMSTERN